MKSATKSTSSKVTTGTRYDEAMRAKICTFLKTHTNQAAKKEFGCSAHFAGKLRAEAKIPHVAVVAVAKPVAAKGKTKGGAAAKAIAAIKGSKKGKVAADLL